MFSRPAFLVLQLFCTFCLCAQEKEGPEVLLKKAEVLAITNYDSALKLAEKAIRLSEEQHKPHALALAWKLKGYCEYFTGNYAAALEFYQKAERISEENGYKDILVSLHNLQGTFYKKRGQLKEALEEFRQGAALAEAQKDSIGIAGFKNDIGLVYELDQKLPEAIQNFKEALLLYKKKGDKGGMSYSLDYLGEAYANQGNFKEALAMMLQCLELRKGSNQQAPIAINLNNIGEIFFLQKNYAAALPYLLESEKISAQIKYSDLRNHTLLLIARCYYQQGNYKSAYDLYEQSALIKDSIYNEKNAHIINEMDAKYQGEKKQLQIEALNHQNALKEAKLSKQKITLWLVALVALLCVAGVLFATRSNRKIKKAHAIITLQKHLVEEKQKEILDSIYYARRIQRSLLTSERYVSKQLARLKEKAR